MTENEALEILNNECEDISKVQIALKVARDAIEEIQQYRAIGTVEGYKRAVKVSKENYYLCAEYKARLKEFEAIGTVEEFKALKEKSVAKKAFPNIVAGKVICPTCNSSLFKTYEHCVKCGQKLDWSE